MRIFVLRRLMEQKSTEHYQLKVIEKIRKKVNDYLVTFEMISGS
jgi:hypothetical protein